MSTHNIECLDQVSIVKVIDIGGKNKYVFNNSSSYDQCKVYGLGLGVYTLTDVSHNHPIAILNDGKEHLIRFSGDKKIDGKFYYGDVTVTVDGNFHDVSVYCPYHGSMGGKNLLKYSSACTPNARCRNLKEICHAKMRVRGSKPYDLGNQNQSTKYYNDNRSYLKARCRTHSQNSSIKKNLDDTFSSTSCTNTECNKRVIFNPSNKSFRTQGAVSSSNRLLRVKVDNVRRTDGVYNGNPNARYVLSSKPGQCKRYRRNGSKIACPNADAIDAIDATDAIDHSVPRSTFSHYGYNNGSELQLEIRWGKYTPGDFEIGYTILRLNREGDIDTTELPSGFTYLTLDYIRSKVEQNLIDGQQEFRDTNKVYISAVSYTHLTLPTKA